MPAFGHRLWIEGLGRKIAAGRKKTNAFNNQWDIAVEGRTFNISHRNGHKFTTEKVSSRSLAHPDRERGSAGIDGPSVTVMIWANLFEPVI